MTEYHVRRHDREITDAARIEDIIMECRYATFALADGGEPYAVTLTYGYDATGPRMYFHVANEGMKLEFVRRNPRACATVVRAAEYDHGECAHPYESVVLRGAMRIVTDDLEKRRALRVLVEHQEDDPDGFWESRRLDSPERWGSFTALCFEIEQVTAKAGS